ncbi:phage tail protein I [Tepidibacter formicigenes]|uniref:Phage tail protein, P2 protein I family n=1 Tax=Tepidibacter formicigenes DSM 15518 TaxID=1123349 RepID=A0A1M6LS85_9FIRM|nr:phage tail protein I [Tepidibacter formicigenes]SHJ73995.1 phage tail protein, P2 protein I family [Tepidibacter formicigenes DSM 15518]
MNNTIYDIDLTRMLPPSLKKDENMLALAKVIGEELQKTSKMARKNIIYARIDELEEEALDILAYDLHVDWYDYSYPIEAKRALIKDSVKVHKRLGTKFAVETALGNLHPNSYVEEWFKYNGEPFSFRVVLDTTHSRAGAGYFEIKKAVDSYKRKSAHMDELIYQCTVKLEIGIETNAFHYKAGITGKQIAGTLPQRNTIGAIGESDVELHKDSEGFKFTSPAAGTVPYRSIIAALHESNINAPVVAEGFKYTAEMTRKAKTGTLPQRNTGASINDGGISQSITAEGYKYNVKRCGTSLCKSYR